MSPSTNPDREQHILDAASDLFVHYGFDKTTVSDIAREAGVSKGAIYLHFDSKDQLLEELILRELKAYAEAWLARLDADPQGGTIAAMYKNSLYALSSSPLMAAIFKQDGRILGSYLRKPDNYFRNQTQDTRHLFVKMMQDAGAVRRDVDARVIAHVMDMLAYGLVAMDEIKDRDAMPPVQDTIEGIAVMMERALTPPDGGNAEAGRAIIKQIADATRAEFEAARQQAAD